MIEQYDRVLELATKLSRDSSDAEKLVKLLHRFMDAINRGEQSSTTTTTTANKILSSKTLQGMIALLTSAYTHVLGPSPGGIPKGAQEIVDFVNSVSEGISDGFLGDESNAADLEVINSRFPQQLRLSAQKVLKAGEKMTLAFEQQQEDRAEKYRDEANGALQAFIDRADRLFPGLSDHLSGAGVDTY